MHFDVDELNRNYRADGFVIARAIYETEEIARLAEACDRLFADASVTAVTNARAQMRRDRHGRDVVDRLDPVSDLDPAIARAFTKPTLVAMLDELIGEASRLFKDKLIWKNPGVSGYELHQDQTFWPGVDAPPEALLTAAIAIDPANGDSGAVKLYPGLHREHYVPEHPERATFSPGAGVMPRRHLGETKAVLAEMRPGDVLVFHPLAPHESGPNRTNAPRRVLMGSYCAARLAPERERFYAGYHAAARGEPPDAHDPT